MAIQRSFMKASIQSNSPGNINWDAVGCFEQYKNDDVYKSLDFNNKTFIEKYRMIGTASPKSTSLPWFLRKVVIPKDYRKVVQEGNK